MIALRPIGGFAPLRQSQPHAPRWVRGVLLCARNIGCRRRSRRRLRSVAANARNLPGVSLAVVKDGRIVKAAGYGVASLELDAPATAQTVYEIGSISKQFAADAILLLVEDGKLRLDDPLSKYLDARRRPGRRSPFATS